MRKMFLFLVLAVVHGAGLPDEARAADPPLIPSAEVQSILGIPLRGREALALAEQYVARRTAGARDAELKPLVERIADATVRGVEPDLLGYVDRIDVRSTAWFLHTADGNPKHASMWAALKRQMAQLATEAADASPEKARILAQALIVIVAHNRVEFDGDSIPHQISGRSLYDLAQLTHEQRQRIDALRNRLRAQRVDCLVHYKATSDILTQLIETTEPRPLWESSLPAYIEHLRAGWPKCPDTLSVRFFLVSNTWRLACLARHHGIQDVPERLAPVIADLKAQSSDPVVLRWLDEVLTLKGGPPTRPVVKVIVSPNEAKPGRPE